MKEKSHTLTSRQKEKEISRLNEINQHCAYVIEEALKQGVIHNAGEGSIDTQFVRNVEDQHLKSDMR